jgi:hypothetical protein
LKWLQEKGHKITISADQMLSAALDKYVVLEKEKCEGLNEDIKWRSAQIKRNHRNLRGYRIDFDGESKERAFVMLSKIVADEGKPPEENFDENVTHHPFRKSDVVNSNIN